MTRGHRNPVAPSKRPLHTIIPGMVTSKGRTDMSFGVMDGYCQAMGHAHLISKVVDYGMDLQEAIDLPRLIPVGGAQVIRIDWENGTLTGASESRKDGIALGF